MNRTIAHRPPRPAFTLVEMVIVLLIIAILFALLLPAIAGAVRRSTEARVLAEIDQLATALELFKDKYHTYPPSLIVLRENGGYTQTPGGNTVDDLSIQYLRKIWPQIRITTDGTPADTNGDGMVTAADGFDWNGDGQIGGAFVLDGPECLVFFLGGIPTGTYQAATGLRVAGGPAGGPAGTLGFGRDPLNPAPIVGTPVSRDTPFFQFQAPRLQDTDDINGDGDPDGDGLWACNEQRIDLPYAYFSAYDGKGYHPNDASVEDFDGDGVLDTGEGEDLNGSGNLNRGSIRDTAEVTPATPFRVVWPTPALVQSVGPNPYTISAPNTTADLVRYYKPQSFQIIAPGPDGKYGGGGPFDPTSSPTTASQDDADNLTNFYTTTLGTSQ